MPSRHVLLSLPRCWGLWRGGGGVGWPGMEGKNGVWSSGSRAERVREGSVRVPGGTGRVREGSVRAVRGPAKGMQGPAVAAACPAHPASPRRPHGSRPMARSGTAPPLPHLARSVPATIPARTTSPGGPAGTERQPMKSESPEWAGLAGANRVRAAAAAEAALGSSGDARRPGSGTSARHRLGLRYRRGRRTASPTSAGRGWLRGRAAGRGRRPLLQRATAAGGQRASGWRKRCGEGIAKGRPQGRAARCGPARGGGAVVLPGTSGPCG